MRAKITVGILPHAYSGPLPLIGIIVFIVMLAKTSKKKKKIPSVEGLGMDEEEQEE